MKSLLLKLLYKMSPFTQGNLRCAYYNFVNKVFFLRESAKFSLKRSGAKSYLLKVGDEEIHIAIPNRVGFYKDGILKRINALQASFYSDKGITEGAVIIDIGANIGEYAISFPDSVIVHAFEMDPNVMPSLLLNCDPRKNIQIHNMGLWSEPKTMDMFIMSDSADTSLIDNGASETHSVNCVRLDDVQAISELAEITMIKCDAEGAEPEVLSGAIETLKKTKCVAIDCGPERGVNSERTDKPVKELLFSLGFEIVKERFGNREILVARNTVLH
jgi:FkbM family methyltransferase